MSNSIFIDTAFVIALVNRRDAYHAKAIELIKRHHGLSLFTTEAILLEIGNALAKNFKQPAIEIIDDFLASDDVDIVWLDRQLFGQAYALYKQHQDKEWGLIDCISFVAMREKNVLQALTPDQHFTQAGFQALMRE